MNDIERGVTQRKICITKGSVTVWITNGVCDESRRCSCFCSYKDPQRRDGKTPFMRV